MKKIFSFVSIIGLISTFIVNGFVVTACISDYGRSYNVSLLRWKKSLNLTLAQIKFVKQYESKVHRPANANSSKKFDDLYDNNPANAIWSNYHDLETDLIRPAVGQNKIDVNWTKMYKKVGLSNNELQEAQQHQLRFYNIFAKIYDKTNVLNLIQKVEMGATKENIIASTVFNTACFCQWMVYGRNFVNKNLIEREYQSGFWSSNNIITVSTHEYGHALSNFLGLTINERQRFNTNWGYKKLKDNISNNRSRSLMASKPISNRTRVLIDYLGEQANISNQAEKLLFGLIVVDSNYGRSAFKYFEPNLELEDEFFAESMAGWLLTPKSKRNWGWELKNDFFLNYLWKKLL